MKARDEREGSRDGRMKAGMGERDLGMGYGKPGVGERLLRMGDGKPG